jgi:hypothetical protein
MNKEFLHRYNRLIQIFSLNKLFTFGAIISVLFVLINLLTLNWFPLPWLDEVGTSDTSINVVLYGKWFSTAWQYSYNLLHAFLLISWIWIFGVSHAAVISLNIVIALILCILLLNTLIKYKIISSYWALILFQIMFWGSSILSWNFRCGRIDVLIMLFTYLVIIEILNVALFNKKGYIKLFISSLLLFFSGIPSVPLIIYFLFILFISLKQSRKVIFKQTFIFISACFVAFCLISIFYYFNNSVLRYWGTFICFNATIKGDTSFLNRIIVSYKYNAEALIFSFVNIIIVLYFLHKRIVSLKNIIVVFGFACLFIPFMITLAGRYQVYYSWMFYIPSFIITIILFEKTSPIFKVSISIITLFIFLIGFPFSLYNGDKLNIKRINQFISKQPISSKSIVISDFIPYFVLKNTTDKCYFPAVCSEIKAEKADSINLSDKGYGKFIFIYKILFNQIKKEKQDIILNKIDFIIKSPDSYGTESLNKFFIKQKSIGKTIIAIDSMVNPKIIIYQIK